MRTGSCLAALLLCAQGLSAQGPGVEARLDTALVQIGDPILLTVTLSYGTQERPDAPDLSTLLERFAARCGSWSQLERGGTKQMVRECQLRLYELGSHQVPAVEVAFVSSGGDTLLRSSTPLDIEVLSARRDGEDQPRDIKPPLAIGGGIPLWLASVAGLVLLALLVLLGRWLWRRKSRSLAHVPPAPIPIDHAAEFARIAGFGLLPGGDFKIYYSLLSENLRRFLEQSLGVEAMEQTTSELGRALRRAGVEGRLTRRIVEYLGAADLVKFARFHPELDAAQRAPDAGLTLLRDVEGDIVARVREAEAHAEHSV